MPESIALAKLIFAKHRNQVIGMIAWIAISCLTAILVSVLFDSKQVMPILSICTMPVMVWSLAMFEFGHNETLASGESNYSHWVLRMPIANWKLVMAPLALRFIWMTGFYTTVVLVAGLVGGIWLPLGMGLLLFFAGGAWVSAFMWRPSRGPWRSVAVAMMACLAYFALFALVASVHFDEHTDITVLRNYPSLVKAAVWALTFVALVSGVWSALEAVALARHNSRGLIPETQTPWGGWLGRINAYFSPDASNRISHRNLRSALAWHDLRRTMLLSDRWVLSIVVLCYVGIVFLSLPIANSVYLLLLFAHAGSILGSVLLESTKLRGTSLPSYIAVSPLTCAEIGFSRALTGVWTCYLLVAVISIAYLLCLAMPDNQRHLGAWIESTNIRYGDANAGYRWMALIVLGVVAAVPSRSLGFAWPTMTGRSRLALAALILPILIVLAAGGVMIAWFLKQTDWESATANAWYWARWVPAILVMLLVIKLMATVVAATLSIRNDLIHIRTTVWIVACWLLVTGGVALTAHALIPDDRVQFAWTWMMTAILLPLGRILVLPYAVYLNRYR